MTNLGSDRKLAAIMFADIVSYSRLMGANESEALKLLKDFEDISSPIVEYLFSWDILERIDLVEAMGDFIENRIYKYLAVNKGIVEVVNEN